MNANVDEAAREHIAAVAWKLMDCLADSGFDDVRVLLILGTLMAPYAERLLDNNPAVLEKEINDMLNVVTRLGIAAMRIDATTHRGES